MMLEEGSVLAGFGIMVMGELLAVETTGAVKNGASGPSRV